MLFQADSQRENIIDIYRVGEKFCEWVDDPLSPDDILESITLYWLTDTFPRAIYTYRQVG